MTISIFILCMHWLFLNVLRVYSAIKQDIDEPIVKKVKKDDVDIELEKKIEEQNKEYFKLRDALEAHTTKRIHVDILKANKQAVPEGNSEVWKRSHCGLSWHYKIKINHKS